METFDWRITIHDSWLRGEDEYFQVPITAIYSSPIFSLRPTDEEDRARIAVRHGYCRTCDGRGAIPAGAGAIAAAMTCPRCKGKGKSMDDPEIRHAILHHVVGSWANWRTDTGTEIPFTEDNLARIARHPALYAVIVAASQELKISYRQEIAENLDNGPPTLRAAEENGQK